MANLNRIQVANFLSDGYVEGKPWAPLYRGETLRFFGQSAAFQLDNGGGKTSLTEACLYLLSRDRRLKPRVADRIAPSDKGWTHIRMEFIEKPHNDNLLQRDLITELPEDIPGKPYVIGLCWSRGKDPFFYRYPGYLEDAPCYRQSEHRLELVDNDTFRRSVESIPNYQWNKWRTHGEWHEEISQFTSIEVVKQNVEFQVEGAGDYSAMVNKVKPENGESYDVAFFRQFVAPELLKQPLGVEGDVDEQHFEDTLFKTLKPTADALVDIARQQSELNQTVEALDKLKPVESRAQEFVDVKKAYTDELEQITRNAAIVHALVEKDPLPGIPKSPVGIIDVKDKELIKALSQIFIEKNHGPLMTGEGASAIIGIDTKQFDEIAKEKGIAGIPLDANAIGLTATLTTAPRNSRKSTAKGYGFKAILSLMTKIGAYTVDKDEFIKRTFAIAEKIDTNIYRSARRQLSHEFEKCREALHEAEQEFEKWNDQHDKLQNESREVKECQIAYETFLSRKEEFPEAVHEAPLKALAWAEEDSRICEKTLKDHIEKSGRLTEGYHQWQDLSYRNGITPLTEVLSRLEAEHLDLEDTLKVAETALSDAKAENERLSKQLRQAQKNFDETQRQYNELSKLEGSMQNFVALFGDVDPRLLNPQQDLTRAQDERRDNDRIIGDAEREKSVFESLRSQIELFRTVFGDADPASLDPTRDLSDHRDRIRAEKSILDQHNPFVEALTSFREAHPEQSPEEWLKALVVQRDQFKLEAQQNTAEITRCNEELAELRRFAVADDRVYAKALKTLEAHQIPFQRLHERVTAGASVERRKTLLTLFSAMLSAPVITSDDEAEQATQILEAAKLTVPVFRAAALDKLIQGNTPIAESGVGARWLWVGRRTRQVEILLDPRLLEYEKTRLKNELARLEARNIAIEAELATISDDHETVQSARKAGEGIQKGSETIYQIAFASLKDLEARSPELERRADEESLDAIKVMKQFVTSGGEARYQELSNIIIPDLQKTKYAINERIAVLKTQTTEEASRTLFAAKDFIRKGGREELSRLADAMAIEQRNLDILQQQLSEHNERIEAILEPDVQAKKNRTDNFNKTYYVDINDLKKAIQFEEDGHVDFMRSASETRKTLDQHAQQAKKRLQGIDFERAERHLQSTQSSERSISDRIAHAKSKKEIAEALANQLRAQREILSEQLTALAPFVERMHELAASVYVQYLKIGELPEVVRNQVVSEPIEHSEILKRVNTLRMAFDGGQPSIHDDILYRLTEIKTLFDDLEIDTRQLQNLDQQKNRAQQDFERLRDEFCKKARAKEIKGLHALEIDLIASAQSLEELNALHQLKERIASQIEERQAILEKSRDTMETNKQATFDNLVKLANKAKANLKILDDVMKRNPDARFHVEVQVADEDRILRIIESLIAEIEDRERSARERSNASLNEEIERRNKSYKDLIHEKIYHTIFVDPRVYFTHASIRGEDKTLFRDKGLSTGQLTALMMMWLIKQAEYALARVAKQYTSRKEQKAALRNSHRLMFFDGLFSNLSNEDYINHAFQGLKDVGDSFQLIGLIHNPHYVNNKDIFPVHLVGKRKLATKGDQQRVFVAVEPGQAENGMVLYTSAFRHKRDLPLADVANG